MKYVCERCGVTTEELKEMPEKCPTCGAPQEKLTLVDGITPPIIETEPKVETPSTFGIRSSPDEIKRILKLIAIPTGETNSYKGFQKIVMHLTEDKLTNYQVAAGEVILTILELDTDFFKETWESGDIVLNSSKSLTKMKILGAYDTASIQVDNDNKVVLHQAGTDAGFSDNLEDASHIISSRPEMPVPFDYKTYKPKIDEESKESEFKWHVKVDTSSFKPLFEVTKESSIDFYPFNLKDGSLTTGVGDMMNPGMDGAFNMNIPIVAEESVLPSEDILVEVGPLFKDVMNNLSGKVEIHFAGNELPLWIIYDITKSITEGGKTVEKSYGKMGYIIPPRSE